MEGEEGTGEVEEEGQGEDEEEVEGVGGGGREGRSVVEGERGGRGGDEED